MFKMSVSFIKRNWQIGLVSSNWSFISCQWPKNEMHKLSHCAFHSSRLKWNATCMNKMMWMMIIMMMIAFCVPWILLYLFQWCCDLLPCCSFGLAFPAGSFFSVRVTPDPQTPELLLCLASVNNSLQVVHCRWVGAIKCVLWHFASGYRTSAVVG